MRGSHARQTRARSPLLLVAAAVGLLLPAVDVATTASAMTPARSGIYLGVAGDIESVRERTGASLAEHHYGYFERSVPSGRMVTVRFRDYVPWRTTAALSRGSARYEDIARWADTLKNRGTWTMVAFHHEPESSGNTKFGTASEFKAAYRKVVDIFRARGATNVAFTWQMTSYAFRADRGAHNYAPDWYPGDGYVDVVAADPYNWYTCGHGRGRWVSLESLMDPVLAFARPRDKQVALGEFATVRNSRRPEWIRQGGEYLAQNDNVIVAAFYFNRRPTNLANDDCTWPLSSDADFAAIKDLAARSIFLG